MADLHGILLITPKKKVETYINSGNLVFDAGKLSAADTAALLEKAIQKHFGFPVDVVTRTEKQWKSYR